MSNASKTPQSTSRDSLSFFIALASGVCAFAIINLVISRFGVQPLASLVFSGLCGVAVMGFVQRERNLLRRLKITEREGAEQIAHLQDELDYLSQGSIVSVIEYDAGNLLIGRVSSGFYQLMSIEPSRELHGKELTELLGCDVASIERLTDRVRRNDLKDGASLTCRRSSGDTLKLNVSGRFIEERYMIELCLVCSPDNFKKFAELQQMMDDLERFRKGMLRREKRIIDLKGEVNELLAESKLEPRYKVTAAAESGRIADMLTEFKETKHGGE